MFQLNLNNPESDLLIYLYKKKKKERKKEEKIVLQKWPIDFNDTNRALLPIGRMRIFHLISSFSKGQIHKAAINIYGHQKGREEEEEKEGERSKRKEPLQNELRCSLSIKSIQSLINGIKIRIERKLSRRRLGRFQQ